jgi:hypothetical protein
MEKGWKFKKEKTNLIVGTDAKPTQFKSGEVIINKKSTKKHLDKLIEINNDGVNKEPKGKVTNDATDGGLLKGKPHYDENGNPTGGIPGVVDGVKNIETEGDEFVVNAEASRKHWKELSKINQEDGNGVAIGPQDGNYEEDPEEEYSKGGKIEFNPNHIPNKWILQYAKKIKKDHPEIWKLGGNIFGNEAFENLKRVSERGYWLDSEEWMYIKWRSYVARHQRDYHIGGVVAMLKWVDKVGKGWPYMKQLIEEKIAKKGWKHKQSSKMSKGGGVVTYKDKYNKKYGYKKGQSHSLEQIHIDSGVSMKGLQQIYDKGIGAYKTNPSSVRPNVTSKEQWAMARVYSSVMGGKAAKIDSKELKMSKGGGIGQEITCHNCGWDWNTNQSEEFDKYVCHNCGTDNSKFYTLKEGGKVNEKTIRVKIEYLEEQFYKLNKEMDVPISVFKQYNKTGKVPREFLNDLTSEIEDKNWVETNPMSVHLTLVEKMEDGGNTSLELIKKAEEISNKNEYLNCDAFCHKMVDNILFKDEFNIIPHKINFKQSFENQYKNLIEKIKVGDILAFGEKNRVMHYAIYLGGDDVLEVEMWGGKPRKFSLKKNLYTYENIAFIYRDKNKMEDGSYLGKGGSLMVKGNLVKVGDTGIYNGRVKENITVTSISPKIVTFVTSNGVKKGVYTYKFEKFYIPSNVEKQVEEKVEEVKVETKQDLNKEFDLLNKKYIKYSKLLDEKTKANENTDDIEEILDGIQEEMSKISNKIEESQVIEEPIIEQTKKGKMAYEMTLDEYQAKVSPIIKEYRKFIKKYEKWFAPASYYGLLYLSLEEVIDAFNNDIQYRNFSMPKKDSWTFRNFTPEQQARYEYSYRKTRNFDENYTQDHTPQYLIDEKNNYINKFREFFTEEEINSRVEQDELKSNKRSVKRAIDNGTYAKMLKSGEITIERLNEIGDSVGVRIPRSVLSPKDKLKAEFEEKKNKALSQLPRISVEKMDALIQSILEDLKPLEAEIFIKERKRILELFSKVTKLQEISIKDLAQMNLPQINVYIITDIRVIKENNRIKEKFVKVDLNDNWEIELNKALVEFVEALKYKIIFSIINNFDRITVPIAEIERLGIKAGNKGFEGQYKFMFENGCSFIFETQSIPAGGYNIQAFHYRFLSNFIDVKSSTGEKIPNNQFYQYFNAENYSKLEKEFDQGGNIDKKDTVTLDIPLLIRTLELAREDIKSDEDLHKMVERLLNLKNKKELTMDDYEYIAKIQKLKK